MKTETMPKSITAMKAFTYSVEEIVDDMASDNDVSPEEITLEMVFDRIKAWASEDLATSRNDLTIYRDQDGNEIEL
jgi:hypothetical protein